MKNEPVEDCPHNEAFRLKKAVTKEVFDPKIKRYFIITVSPIFDENKNLVCFLHLMRDITEIKETEEALRYLENFHREIIDHAPLGMIRIDENFRIVHENKKMKEILGVPEGEESEAMGRDIRKLSSVKKAKLNKFFHDLEKGREVEVELPFTSIYGKTRILHCIAVPIMKDKRFSGAVILAEDITRRKEMEQKLRESEEMFRKLAENSLVGIYKTNLRGEILYVNPAIVKMLGYSSADEFLGKSVIPVYKKPEERKKFIETLKKHGKITNFVGEYLKKDGGSIIALESATLEGEIISGMIMDITEKVKMQKELKKAHEKLKLAYEELRTLDELKSNILANLSHELRTPMTIASNAIELMREVEDEETKKKLYEMAKRAIHREYLIVEDLLEASKLRSIDEERLKFECFDLNALVELAVEELKYLANEKGIEIYFDFDENLPKINADVAKILRAIKNLLHNAIKFNKEKGYIKIKTRKENSYAEISISDSGVGIPSDKKHRIFEPFYQIDSSMRRKYGGIGMGLFVVKKIINAHKGKIEVESKPGEGSTFRVFLPIDGKVS